MKKKIFILSFIWFFLDRVSKLIISNYFDILESKSIINNFFRITYVINDGAAFSIFKGGKWIFVSLGIIFLILVGASCG